MDHQLEFNKPSENPVTSAGMPQVSEYMNYRQYLADWFAARREQTKSDIRPYGYPMFSAAADIKSPNYLKMIIDGRRNLSEDMIGKFGKALGLHKEQTEELRYMVRSSQAADPAERNEALRKLSEMRVERKLKTGEIDRKTWEKVPNWVAWVLYAMVDQEGASFDMASLKALLRGKASENDITEALNGLLASGELTRDEKTGEIVRSRHLIENADDVPVALIRKLQSQLMLLGLESLYQDSATEREFGTLTMSMTKAEFDEVKFKLRQMRKAIHKDNAIARTKEKGERVYQLNIQLFPVTNRTAPGLKTQDPKSEVRDLIKDARLAAESFIELSKSDPV